MELVADTLDALVVRGLSVKELAAREGVNVSAIKNRLWRARKAGHPVPRLNTGHRRRVRTFTIQPYD